jgi:preprotein translocase subunit SecD
MPAGQAGSRLGGGERWPSSVESDMSDLKYSAVAVLILFGACGSPARHAVRTGEVSLQVASEVACGTSGASAPRAATGGQAHCFSSGPLLDENDVISALTDQTANGRPLVLTLNANAAARLRQFTGQNIGRHLGVFVNGRLVSVPMIAAPTSRVWVSGYTGDEERQLLKSFGPAR